MRIAIHHQERSYSARWIEYCKEHQLDYQLVNCFDSGIVEELRSFDALLWHWRHYDPPSVLMARSVIAAASVMGIAVYPDINTCWHYDDKIAQKYLLEAIEAPLVPTYVFYDLADALRWIEKAEFPKVFKLRKGAGSANVMLIKNRREAQRLAKRAFKGGFPPVRKSLSDAKHQLQRTYNSTGPLATLRKIFAGVRRVRRLNSFLGREIGYFYAQDFIPGNTYDTRIVVIGEKAFGFVRYVRENDFRASGGGAVDHSLHMIDLECVRVAFDVTRRTKAQSLAFDFLKGPGGAVQISEISYCFPAYTNSVYNCPGYWDERLNWHEGHVNPEDAILIDLIEEVGAKQSFRR